MKAVYSFLFLFLFLSAAKAQSFPADFTGHWKGEIDWFQQGSKIPKKVPVQLRVYPADLAGQFTWQIIYGQDGTDNRPYVLKPVDTAKGHWAIDEGNGIVLDQYWIGNKLTGVFSLGTSTIFNSYRVEKDKLFLEFVMLPVKPMARTGNGTEEVPYVDSYTIKSYQLGILSRVKAQQPLPLQKPK